CRANRKAIFNRDMTPNIPENPRGRKTPKRGRKQRFDPAIFEERFRTIERVFAWEDTHPLAGLCQVSNQYPQLPEQPFSSSNARMQVAERARDFNVGCD
nr:hypothetical protein [Paraburkholderia terrae]